jgi:hypothetical protein
VGQLARDPTPTTAAGRRNRQDALVTSPDLEVSSAALRLDSTLGRHGVDAEFEAIPAAEIAALAVTPALSPELASLYETHAPTRCVLEFSPERLTLYAPRELSERQQAYRTGEWQDSWLAIGDSSGDPVIADTAKEGTPVALAIHGMGEWRPRRIAPSLSSFLNALSEWVAVLYGQFGGEMLDENRDFEVKTGFVDAVGSALASPLPTECVEEWLNYIVT